MSDSPTSDPFADDLLNRHPFGQELEQFLLIEHHFVEGSLVVSLNAPFGSGKTTFLQMWAADLSERRNATAELPRPVIINAWESDYCGDPLLAMVSALSRALSDANAPAPEPTKAESIREAAKDLLWFGVGLANGFVSQATGVDSVAAGQLAIAKREARQEPPAPSFDALNVFEERTKALVKLKAALVSAFGDNEPKAIVLIDELDRCRPDYAISYLETIKHIFNVHGIVFVLAVDEAQLASAAGVLFGNSLNFTEYYRKFSHRTISLPAPEAAATKRLVREYCARYLVHDSKRSSAFELDHHKIENISELFSAFRLRPRQIQEAFRILGHAAASPPEKKMQFTSWTFEMSVLFMSALRVANRTAYEKFGITGISPADINDQLRTLGGKLSAQDWWFRILVSSLPRSPELDKLILHEMRRSGWIKSHEEEAPDLGRILSDFSRGWNRYRDDESGLALVYAHIEGLKNFAK